MLVKCFPVPNERTPKKVEVTLGRVSEHRKNTVRLNVRIAGSLCEDSENPPVEEAVSDPIQDDNLSGIIPVSQLSSQENAETEDIAEIEDVFESYDDCSECCDAEDNVSDEDLCFRELSASDIHADFEALENDLRKLEDDLRSQLGDDEPTETFAELPTHDEGIVRRHFVRDDTGELYESDSANAEGHEVACYDNSGRLTRACGIIRKGQPLFKSPDDDDIYNRAVSDMFSDGND